MGAVRVPRKNAPQCPRCFTCVLLATVTIHRVDDDNIARPIAAGLPSPRLQMSTSSERFYASSSVTTKGPWCVKTLSSSRGTSLAPQDCRGHLQHFWQRCGPWPSPPMQPWRVSPEPAKTQENMSEAKTLKLGGALIGGPTQYSPIFQTEPMTTKPGD